MNFAARERNRPTAWRDIWGAGQGLGSVDDVPTVAVLIERLRAEYAEAGQELDAARFTIA
jgi:nitronate monooxygenase